jgi:hypothetical protein
MKSGDFRDEKTVLGVGESQVRNSSSVEIVPALEHFNFEKVEMARSA